MQWHETTNLLRHRIDSAANGVVIRLAGEIDCTAAVGTRELLNRAVAAWPSVTVDLSRVTFIDARGLGALMAVRRSAAARGTYLVLHRPHRAVQRLLELAQLETAFEIVAPQPMRAAPDVTAALERAVDEAVQATTAAAGMAQLVDDSGVLHLVAQQGFSQELLDFFEIVEDPNSPCGQVATMREPVLLEDLTDCPGLRSDPLLDVLLAEGSRAVGCMPVVGPDQSFVAVLSVHHRAPMTWGPEERARFQQVAARAGSATPVSS